MAWTKEYQQYQRWDMFHFFDTLNISLAFAGETITLEHSTMWILQEMRFHFSTQFISQEFLKIRISSINGSYYNILLLSQNLNLIQDIRVYYSEPLHFFSDDKLIFYISDVSHAQKVGMEVLGWAVKG